MSDRYKQNYIYEYYQQIQDGRQTVGIWIRLVYEMIIKGLEQKLFYFDQKKANHAIRFIENFCHHSKGRLAPGLLTLELWELAMISCIFGIMDWDGRRQFREVFILVGRKCGKSLLAAGIAEYMAYADREYGADVYFLAPKIDQTEIVYNAFWRSVELEPDLRRATKKRKSDLYIAETNTTIKKIAFSAQKSDGFNPHCTINDEIAAWKGDAGLKQYEVMTSALGSRLQPLTVSITTANYINDGIFDELFKRSTRVLKGDGREMRLLPFLYMIDDVEKWYSLDELQKSLPNLGVSVSVDYMLEEIAKAEGSLSKKIEFLTKYCNIKQNSSVAWLPAKLVEAACGEQIDPEILKNSYCVGGIDLSQTRDLTSACAVIEKDGQLYVLSHFWMPGEKIDDAIQRDGLPYQIYIQRGLLSPSGDNFVDYNDCLNWFRELVEKYKIFPLKVGYDRYSAQYLVQQMKEYGFHMDDVYQGENLYGVIQETQGMLEDGRIRIGDNDLLKVHMLDSALKMSTERGRGRLVKLKPSVHIDGMAALLDAMTVRQKYYGEIGEQLKNEEKDGTT